ncbi:hypothetical protein Patl1_27810 [Pistacia atlantica]|uniref:Uncharacterized protein n=1 Tax=Pistacia atlantica TaxID=434234 RepID=A0ACC1BC50_9ROSI|nr:hypothetical protein Patl1_27810 [Pistacia atlantica]
MVKVGLWCVQDEPALRPSMKSVVMMLEGIIDVSIPPCPSSSSGCRKRSNVASGSVSLALDFPTWRIYL